LSSLSPKGRFQLKQNVTYQITDKNGKVKPIFTENALGKFLLRQARKVVTNPITSNGEVKKGLLAHIAAYGVRIPLLTGNYSDFRLLSNLTTTAGKGGVASRINGSGGEAAFTYIEVGIGTTAAAITDTTLESAITDSGLARVAATASRVNTDTTNDTAQLATTFSVSGTKAVTESGVLNAGSGGVLLARQVFSAINVISGDSLTITWKFDVD
jgi:hypothetical protein